MLVCSSLLFVGGGALLGPAASHIDLINSGQLTTPQSNGNTATGNSQVVGSPDVTTTQTPTPSSSNLPISSLGALQSDSGSSLGLLFLPIVLGALIGGLFYGFFTRRADAE